MNWSTTVVDGAVVAEVERERAQHRVRTLRWSSRPANRGTAAGDSEAAAPRQRVVDRPRQAHRSARSPAACPCRASGAWAARQRTGTSAGTARDSRGPPRRRRSHRPRTKRPDAVPRRSRPRPSSSRASRVAQKLRPSATCRRSVSHVALTSPDQVTVPKRCWPRKAERVRFRTRLLRRTLTADRRRCPRSGAASRR